MSETSALRQDNIALRKVNGDDHATVHFGTGVHLP